MDEIVKAVDEMPDVQTGTNALLVHLIKAVALLYEAVENSSYDIQRAIKTHP